MVNKALSLSVIIPAYNEEDHIRACLQSFAMQSELPDQVLVVDNNSTDNTVEIARSFSFVTVIKESRQGLYYSRKKGMDAATSEILCRIDADTFVDQNWVRNIKQTFRDAHVMAATGPVGYHDMPFPNFTCTAEDKLLRIARLTNYEFLMGANMALRKEAWQLVRDELCNEPYLFEDIDIAIHLSTHNIAPTYIPTMRASVSSRRFQSSPREFMRYIGGHTRTHDHHASHSPAGAKFAEGAFALVYFGVKPLHMMYDPRLRRPSLSYLLTRRNARPDPMTVR